MDKTTSCCGSQKVMFDTTLCRVFPLPVSLVDEAGRILYMNAAMERLVGPSSLGRFCHEAYRDDNKVCDGCPRGGSLPIGETVVSEIPGCLGGRTLEITHTGIEFEGRPAILEVFVDVTARKTAEEAFRKKVQDLENFQRVALKRELRMAEIFNENEELKARLKALEASNA